MNNIIKIEKSVIDTTPFLQDLKISVSAREIFTITDKPGIDIYWGPASAIFRWEENRIYINPHSFNHPRRRRFHDYYIGHELTHWSHFNHNGISKSNDFLSFVMEQYGDKAIENINAVIEVIADCYFAKIKDGKYYSKVCELISYKIDSGNPDDADSIICNRIIDDSYRLNPLQQYLKSLACEIEVIKNVKY